MGLTRRLLSLTVFLLPLPSTGETLLQVYELAKENDHQLQADIAKYRAELEAANISRSSLLPSISGDAVYSESDSSLESEPSSTDSLTYGVSLQQSLINFNALNTYRRGKAQTSSAEVQLAADQQSVIIRSAEAYFNVLSALDQLRSAKTEEKALATQLEQTSQRYEVGLISINEVHEAQASLDSAVADALVAENQVGIQIEALATITGQYPSQIIPLKDSFIATPPVPDSKQAWIDFAMKNNLGLQARKLAVETATYTTKISESDRLPTLTGRLRHQQNDDITGDTGDFYTNSVQLELSVPIYTGGRTSAETRQASQNQIRAEELLKLEQRNAIQETRSLFLSVTTDIAQIKARQQAIVSSQSALEATQAGYEAGTRDIVDTLNAQRNLFRAERNYSDALYGYILNSLRLKEVAGLLTEKDLQQLEAWLDTSKPIAISL